MQEHRVYSNILSIKYYSQFWTFIFYDKTCMMWQFTDLCISRFDDFPKMLHCWSVFKIHLLEFLFAVLLIFVWLLFRMQFWVWVTYNLEKCLLLSLCFLNQKKKKVITKKTRVFSCWVLMKAPRDSTRPNVLHFVTSIHIFRINQDRPGSAFFSIQHLSLVLH